MSGDVFGNGLLRSKATRLVAAFDHRDIFLDPNPNAAASFDERQRLYDLPRSSWQDYNRDLISAGGGVYSRGLKSIEITPEVREVLGLDESVTELAPTELISAILKAPVDLIYNGGIGTYVKASTETNAQVGDKANDALRVNGKDLRAKIVGEGGNLGFTQLGRIEAALNGVILNTDAIDNSAGVETSDREVNIKILVDRLVAHGELSSEERASFIESLQDEVGGKVLETNVEQNVLLQGEFHGSFLGTNLYKRLMHDLEEHAGLNRAVEFLPTDEELDARLENTGERLTRPELSVLAAYVKIYLTHALEQTDFADDPYLEGVLRSYFPAALVERFGQYLDSHPLRKEIICTRVANELVNIGGITFAYRVMEEFNVGIDSVARAFIVATCSGRKTQPSRTHGTDARRTENKDGDSRIVNTPDVQLLHLRTSFAATVTARLHRHRELIGTAERREKERHEHGYDGSHPPHDTAVLKVRPACLLRLHDAIQFLQQRRNKAQGNRHHHRQLMYGNAHTAQRREKCLQPVGQAQRARRRLRPHGPRHRGLRPHPDPAPRGRAPAAAARAALRSKA